MLTRKCTNCGDVPPASHTSSACDVCFHELMFWCESCRDWSPHADCSNCRERVEGERALAGAIRAGQVTTALALAEKLATKFRLNKGFQQQYEALKNAQQLWQECQATRDASMERWRDIRHAQSLLTRASSAFQLAGLPRHELTVMASELGERAAELEGIERLRWQVWLAFIPAVIAGYLAMIVYACAHLFGVALANRSTGSPTELVATYNWGRIGVCAAAFVILIGIVARRSWGLSAYVMAALQLFGIANLLLILSYVTQFTIALPLFALACGALAWFSEAGADPKANPPNRIRGALSSLYLGQFRRNAAATLAVSATSLIPLLLVPFWNIPDGKRPPKTTQQLARADDSEKPTAKSTADSTKTPTASDAPATPAPPFVIDPRTLPPRPKTRAELIEEEAARKREESAARGSGESGEPNSDGRPPADFPLVLRAELVNPSEKVLQGDLLTVRLSTNELPNGVSVEFEAWKRGEDGWARVYGDSWIYSPPELGPLEVAFRAIERQTGKASENVKLAWDVYPKYPPVVSLKSPPPRVALPGEQLVVELTSDQAPFVEYEYRRAGVEEWLPAGGSRVEIEAVMPAVQMSFRAVSRDGKPSNELDFAVAVEPPMVRVKRTHPAQPCAPGTFTIELEANSPRKNLEFQWRKPSGAWQKCEGNVIQVPIRRVRNLLKSGVQIEVQVIDHELQLKSEEQTFTWAPLAPRFVALGMRTLNDRPFVNVRDQQTEKVISAEVGTMIEDFRVTRINEKAHKIYLHSEEAGSLELRIPPNINGPN